MSLKEIYKEKVVPEMKKEFSLKNYFQVPEIEKVVINAGVGKFLKEEAALDEIRTALGIISGQRPIMTKSKKSIAGFKIREGLEVGMKVTLRGTRMWNFLERFNGAALPRVRDFRGITESSVDKSGNLNIGLKEHFVFPEIIPEQIKTIFGFEVAIVTNARDHVKGLRLFQLLGFPIEKKDKSQIF